MDKFDVLCIVFAFLFNCLDFVSGFVNAWKLKRISSKKMREGLFHKVGFWLTYLLAILFNYANTYLKIKIPINMVYVVAIYVIITEFVSILENIKKINPDIEGLEKIKKWDELTQFLGGILK